jgi:hypothetical protein
MPSRSVIASDHPDRPSPYPNSESRIPPGSQHAHPESEAHHARGHAKPWGANDRGPEPGTLEGIASRLSHDGRPRIALRRGGRSGLAI